MARRVAPPPTDLELAAAEETQNRRRVDLIEKAQDEQDRRILAAAGDPEAMNALRSMASVINSTPIGDSEEIEGAPETVMPPKEKRTRAPRAVVAAPAEPPDEREINEQRAFQLMDVAYRKWAKLATTNMSKANRELAIDLGKDTALYLRSGIIRLADLHDTINKLTAVGKGVKEETGEEEDFGGEMEDLRKQLRG